MATHTLTAAPVLSTPETHIFEDPTPPVDFSNLPRLSDEQLFITYEIERTVREIRAGKWRRVALQFPDHMLVDAPRVYEGLKNGLKRAAVAAVANGSAASNNVPSSEEEIDDLAGKVEKTSLDEGSGSEERLFILADTSYGACCVDEVAAEHVDADVVVHYGRSCLSPTARLPVIYVFTTQPLDLDGVQKTFKETYPEKDDKIILMADIPYSNHLPNLLDRLKQDGYTNLYATEIIHNPSSPLPNRSVPGEVEETNQALREHKLFHISDPPPALLLTLSSRVGAIHIYPTTAVAPPSSPPSAILASSTLTLRRRYALLTSLNTASVFGILINTLSVKNYMHILSHVKKTIEAAGKKSYTFVVGKVNAAKVANFSEIEGWVVIGCWESSLVESKEFWRPLITPFELGMVRKGDGERVWTGEWRSDFQAVLEEREGDGGAAAGREDGLDGGVGDDGDGDGGGDGDEYDSEEESAPPEFDLRTGRYVSHSRPMRTTPAVNNLKGDKKVEDGGGVGSDSQGSSSSLVKRAGGDVARVGGVVSPGAEFLRTQRTWQGLGSDFGTMEQADEVGDGSAARMEEGRRGIARGYVVGDETEKR